MPNTIDLAPLGDRILIEPEKPADTVKGGIIIPDIAKTKSLKGKVVAIGTGPLNKAGKRIPPTVAVGDVVLLPQYGGTAITLDGKDYIAIAEGDILGIYTD